MNNRTPVRSPFEWFFHTALLILGGAIALSAAVSLLERIWPWLLGSALVITGLAIGVAGWRGSSRRW